MTKIICSAPNALAEWCSIRNLDAVVDRHELRLPKMHNEGNKAVLCVEKGRYLGSFTIWGRGTTEWIVVDGESGETLILEDAEFTDVTQLYSALELALAQMEHFGHDES